MKRIYQLPFQMQLLGISLCLHCKYNPIEVNETIYEEFQENATMGQQSNPSHAEKKHQKYLTTT